MPSPMPNVLASVSSTLFHIAWILAWGALLLLNVWVFQKTKARGNLLMIVGSAIVLFWILMWALATVTSEFVMYWIPLFGIAIFTSGFFLSVEPMVQAQIDAIRVKVRDMAKSDRPAEPGGSPPPPPPPPPASTPSV